MTSIFFLLIFLKDQQVGIAFFENEQNRLLTYPVSQYTVQNQLTWKEWAQFLFFIPLRNLPCAVCFRLQGLIHNR